MSVEKMSVDKMTQDNKSVNKMSLYVLISQISGIIVNKLQILTNLRLSIKC